MELAEETHHTASRRQRPGPGLGDKEYDAPRRQTIPPAAQEEAGREWHDALWRLEPLPPRTRPV